MIFLYEVPKARDLPEISYCRCNILEAEPVKLRLKNQACPPSGRRVWARVISA